MHFININKLQIALHIILFLIKYYIYVHVRIRVVAWYTCTLYVVVPQLRVIGFITESDLTIYATEK